jgi:hypothetical protein
MALYMALYGVYYAITTPVLKAMVVQAVRTTREEEH